jgi:hypothetical protein
LLGPQLTLSQLPGALNNYDLAISMLHFFNRLLNRDLKCSLGFALILFDASLASG